MYTITFTRIITILSFLLLITQSVFSVPAYRKPIATAQPDGRNVTFLLHGDEYFNYRTTTDGYLITEDSKGYFNYASVDSKGSIYSLGVHANDISKRTNSENLLLKNLHPVNKENNQFQDIVKERRNSAIQKVSSVTAPQKAFPLNGTPRSLVILVNFSDKSFVISNPQQAFTNLLNQEGYSTNGGTGSAKDYFRDNSNGNFNPVFDVVGPYTLTNNMAYYGGNTSGSDKNPRQMVIDACKAADADGVDFTQYDTDNDGYVDNIFIYYAGYNEAEGASANTIWPHRWVLSNTSTKYDTKIIYDYACTSELKGTSGSNMCGIGTFVHEFGHVLGLPDFYATNSATHHTLSDWDVMDYGPYNNSGRTPPNYSAYERFFLGWINPTELKSPKNVTLDTLAASNQAYLISQTGAHNLNGANPSPTEFFMLENRQKKGWDAYLPGHGLLITRVYYSSSTWSGNTVNNTSTSMGVDIIEADGTATDATTAGDTYPGTSNNSSYNPTLRSGTNIAKPLTEIKETNGIITFKFMGGNFPADLAPVGTAATNITQTSFTANWNTVTNVEKFLLDIFEINENDTTYVANYKQKDVGLVTNINIANLADETTYYYRLKAISGDVSTPFSNTIQVTTAAYTFDLFSPIALPASYISINSFVANWAELDGSENYLLNVYKKNTTNEISDVIIDFSTSLSATGWETNCTEYYSASTYYGEAQPSLKFSSNGKFIQSPIFNRDLLNLKFWYKGASSSADNILKITGSFDGTNWKTLKTIQPIQNTSQIITLSNDELAEIRTIKIEYIKNGSGNIAIDDIVLQLNSEKNEFINGLESYNIGNSLSYTINDLEANTNYYYFIQSLKDGVLSGKSNEIAVTTTVLTNTETITKTDINISKNRDNLFIKSTNNQTQLNLIIYDIFGRILLKTKFFGEKYVNTSSLKKGIYIIQVNDNTYTIAL
ncbi:MAG: M6 family metalloprotease domain-containing protein [Paludibacteraceae bacterium]